MATLALIPEPEAAWQPDSCLGPQLNSIQTVQVNHASAASIVLHSSQLAVGMSEEQGLTLGAYVALTAYGGSCRCMTCSNAWSIVSA